MSSTPRRIRSTVGREGSIVPSGTNPDAVDGLTLSVDNRFNQYPRVLSAMPRDSQNAVRVRSLSRDSLQIPRNRFSRCL